MITETRVVIMRNRKILLIHRIKSGKEYYILPGGHIEPGEKPEEAAIREAKEETNLDVELSDLLWKIKDKAYGEMRLGYYFLVKRFKGKKLKVIGPEAKRLSANNRYLFEWVPIKKLSSITFYPEIIRKKILEKFKS